VPGPRLGTVFTATRDAGDLPDAARQAEDRGFHELWLVEDCFAYGGLTAAATALAHTRELAVGVGLLPALIRNPALTAMELGTLATLHPGRLLAGFGHGVRSWMEQIGIAPRDRLVALREVVGAVRGLLDGETLTVDGRFVTLDGVRLDSPPPAPPALLIGTTGPRGIALAAESGGLLLPEGAGERAIAAARKAIGDATLVTNTWVRVDDDGDTARSALAAVAEDWRDRGAYPQLLEHAELPPGPLDAAALARVGIAGTAAECAEGIARFGAAGATTVVVMPVGEAPDAQVERFAADVLPRVRGG
jgi:alkanesulfonate monooxygenase SsuD/methylene tetrahydromethanopterin reductase-like flavin-dependent oxidoreductase (luciferase family)